MAAFATTAWCFRSSVTDLAIEIKHFPKLSWRWRTQESRGPPASASASTTRPARSKEYKIPPYIGRTRFLRCLFTAPCAKYLRLRGKSELGVSVSSPSLTSDPIIMIMITVTMSKGLPLHHPRGRSADVPWSQELSSLLQRQPPLMGLVR